MQHKPFRDLRCACDVATTPQSRRALPSRCRRRRRRDAVRTRHGRTTEQPHNSARNSAAHTAVSATWPNTASTVGPFPLVCAVLSGSTSVGVTVGNSVGTAVGACVGARDGRNVGHTDGGGVTGGAATGVRVGDAVGVPLGVLDGSVVGSTVGLSVGTEASRTRTLDQRRRDATRARTAGASRRCSRLHSGRDGRRERGRPRRHPRRRLRQNERRKAITSPLRATAALHSRSLSHVRLYVMSVLGRSPFLACGLPTLAERTCRSMYGNCAAQSWCRCGPVLGVQMWVARLCRK
jgi:hypothetical protein